MRIRNQFLEDIKLYFQTKGIVVFPEILWGSPDEDVNSIERTLAAFAIDSKKKYAIFAVVDDERPLSVYRNSENVLIFRTSLRRSLQSRNEFLLPYVFDNSANCSHNCAPRTTQPKVAFCGLGWSHPLRALCVDILQRSPLVRTNFVLRRSFWGGRPHDPGIVDDFVRNMRESEFNLCVRGAGNFSMRFYQTLAFGRIPVVLDSDIVLPFASEIEWGDLCVVGSDPNALPTKILEFWQKKDVEQAQRKCEEVYRTFFTNPSVAQYLYKEVERSA